MPVDPMFWLATAAFAWGLSLASYRWFAVHNAWPMGEWQAHRPGLPIAIGLFAMLFALLFALARGGTTALVLPLFGVVCALGWTAITRVGAQSALLLAPLSVAALLVIWLSAATNLSEAPDRSLRYSPDDRLPDVRSSEQRLPDVRGSDVRLPDSRVRDTRPPVVLPPDARASDSATATATRPAATERERDLIDRDRGILTDRPDLRPPARR